MVNEGFRPDAARPELASLAPSREQLTQLREGMTSAFQQAQEMVGSVMELGGSGVLKDWIDNLKNMLSQVPEPARKSLPFVGKAIMWMEFVAGLNIARLGYIKNKLGTRYKSMPDENAKISELVKIAGTVRMPGAPTGPATQGAPRPAAPRMPETFFDRVIATIPAGQAEVTMADLVTAAPGVAEAMNKEAGPTTTPDATTTAPQTTPEGTLPEAQTFRTQIEALTTSLRGFNPAEANAETKQARRREVDDKLTDLSRAMSTATPAVTAERRQAVADFLNSSLRTEVARTGIAFATQAEAIVAVEFGPTLTQQQRDLAIALGLAVGRPAAEREKAVAAALAALNADGAIPPDRTVRESLVTFMNRAYSAALVAAGKTVALTAEGNRFELRARS